jgi:3-oxoacyl-[acyl-carrier protein] reductase
MDMKLKDKVVLVAGSSRGIGEAIAGAFLAEGAKVCITGRNKAKLMQTAEKFERKYQDRVIYCAGDMTDGGRIVKCVSKIMKKWKTIDILVGNIGDGKSKPVLEAGTDEWRKMLGINLLGAVELAGKVTPIMRKNKSGSIVFIASIVGMENIICAPASYASAKAGLISYTKYLAAAVADDNIRVNAVAPGNIKFPGGGWERRIKENPNIIKDYIEKEVAMKRFGKPDEIADAVVFLSSEKASFITGTCLVVDGGQIRRC